MEISTFALVLLSIISSCSAEVNDRLSIYSFLKGYPVLQNPRDTQPGYVPEYYSPPLYNHPYLHHLHQANSQSRYQQLRRRIPTLYVAKTNAANSLTNNARSVYHSQQTSQAYNPETIYTQPVSVTDLGFRFAIDQRQKQTQPLPALSNSEPETLPLPELSQRIGPIPSPLPISPHDAPLSISPQPAPLPTSQQSAPLPFNPQLVLIPFQNQSPQSRRLPFDPIIHQHAQHRARNAPQPPLLSPAIIKGQYQAGVNSVQDVPESRLAFDPIIHPPTVISKPEKNNKRPVPAETKPKLIDRRGGPTISLDKWMDGIRKTPTFWERIDKPNKRGGASDQDATSRSGENLRLPKHGNRGVLVKPVPIPAPAIAQAQIITEDALSNIFKKDGSINNNRAGMINMQRQDETVADRTDDVKAAFTAFVTKLDTSILNHVINSARSITSRPNLIDLNLTEKTSANNDSNIERKDHEVKDRDYISGPSDKRLTINLEQILTNSTQTVETRIKNSSKYYMRDTSLDSEMQDKPFEGIPDTFLTTNYTESIDESSEEELQIDERNTSVDVDEKKDNDDDDVESGINNQSVDDKSKAGGHRKERIRRQVMSGSSFTSNGVSCLQPSKFPTCQFYSRCFTDVNGRCSSQDSFIGDDASALCGDLDYLSRTTESTVLREFLGGFMRCVDNELVRVLEYPSCDDVTLNIANSLLVEGKDNCVAKSENFCRVVETPRARFDLARIFSQPKGRHDFMLSLLVSLGQQTISLCNGPGVNTFLLDLMSNVMMRNTTYKMPGGQQMPVFEP